jgi:AraC-like DNA-binding protein
MNMPELSAPLPALQAAVAAHIHADGACETAIGGLYLMKGSAETIPRHALRKPILCLVVQGAKQATLGDEIFDYGEMQSLIVSLELPMSGRVVRASPERPFLGILLEFDVGLMREVLQAMDRPPRPRGETGLGVFVGDVEGPLADCVLRLMRLLDTPHAIAMLAPAIMREVYFWLLSGRHGGEVCKLAHADGHTRRIAQAINLLRQDFAQPIRIEQLAEAARMSPSSFYQHFKTLTAMTPLQYQKQLRLLEARRLMLADAVNATGAAYLVGYESPSQFSREYARMFGAPPRRDVEGMRATVS